MSSGAAGVAFAISLIGALALIHVPLGDYMFRVFTSKRHLRSERLIYRGIGVDADAEQSWGSYARSVLAFSGDPTTSMIARAYGRAKRRIMPAPPA